MEIGPIEFLKLKSIKRGILIRIKLQQLTLKPFMRAYL
jgi:hypothetical protein